MNAVLARVPRAVRRSVVIVMAAAATLVAAHRGGDNEWAEVSRADLVLGSDVAGTLKAAASELLGPPMIADVWDFKIAFLAADGVGVRQGQPVLGFDTSSLQRDLEQVRADHDQAVKELEKKLGELALARQDDQLKLAEAQAAERKARLKVARPEDLVPSKELAQARLDLRLAEEEVEALDRRMAMTRQAAEGEISALTDTERRAAVRLAALESGIGRMTVTAPRDGTVIFVTNRRDEKKKVGDTCWRMEKVLEIPDLATLTARGEVDEADAGKVAAGQRVRLRLDALPDTEVAGTVRSVSRTVDRKAPDSQLRVVRLEAVLDRVDTERMRPGMRFRGSVEIGRVSNALVVPAEAVFPAPSGPVVYRKTPLGTRVTPVTLGRRNEALVEVLGGLAAGDRVARRAPDPEMPR